jgi:hypothetical protein
VPRAEFACGRVRDDVDGMVVRPDKPALRLLSGPAACMTASWCVCMARGIVPRALRWRCSCLRLVLRVMAHTPVGVGGSLCEAETCHARQRLVGRGGDLSCEAETCRGIPLVGNWSEMLPTGRNRDVLPVWVLTRVLSLPRLESWP